MDGCWFLGTVGFVALAERNKKFPFFKVPGSWGWCLLTFQHLHQPQGYNIPKNPPG